MIKDRHAAIFNTRIKRNSERSKELQKPDSEITRKRRAAEEKLEMLRIEREYKLGGNL